jgi:hypothetical protein
VASGKLTKHDLQECGGQFFMLPRLQEVRLLGQPFNRHRLAPPFGNSAGIFAHQLNVSYRHGIDVVHRSQWR